MSEIPGIGYRPPSYRPAADAVWFSVLYGHVPGFQLEYMYRPNTQGDNPSKLEPQHLRHLDAIIKFLENSAGSPAAFALVNLSTHDTRHRPGRGGLALVCSLRVRGAVDQAGRPGPVFTHSALCVDEPVEEAGLAQVLVDFADRVDRHGTPWYQEYARAGQEHAETEIARYMSHFTSLGAPGAKSAQAPLRRRDPLGFRRLEIVCPQGLSLDAPLAQGAARLAALLYHSNLRWAYVTNGSVPGEDSAAELSVRFVSVHGSGAGVHTLDLDGLLRMEGEELLQLLHLAADSPAPVVHFHPVQAAPPPASALPPDAPTPPMALPPLGQETVPGGGGETVVAQEETVVSESASGARAAAPASVCEEQTMLAGNEPITPQLPFRTGDETQMLDKDRMPVLPQRRAPNGARAPKKRRPVDLPKVQPKTQPLPITPPAPPVRPPPERGIAEKDGSTSDEMTRMTLAEPRPAQRKKGGEPGLLLMSLAGALMVLVVVYALRYLSGPEQPEIRPLPQAARPQPKQDVVEPSPRPEVVWQGPPKPAPMPPTPRAKPISLARMKPRAKPVWTSPPPQELGPPMPPPEELPQPKKTDAEKSDELVRDALAKANNARNIAATAFNSARATYQSCAMPPGEMQQAYDRVDRAAPEIEGTVKDVLQEAKETSTERSARALQVKAEEVLKKAKTARSQANAVQKYANQCKKR